MPSGGMADALVARLDAARRAGLDVAADQYPYAAAATTLSTVLPPAILALPTDEIVAAIRDTATRARIRDDAGPGLTGWENVTADPGWAGIVIRAQRVATRVGRPIARGPRGRPRGRPGRPRARRPRRRPARGRRRHPLHGRARPRDDHARALDRGLHGRRGSSPRPPDPRRRAFPIRATYGSTARVLGEFVRERGVIDLETAVAKLSAVPAARVGLRDRGVLAGGRGRRRRGVRPADRGRPRHLRAAGRAPGGDPGRARERPDRDPRRPRDRRAPGPPPAARRLRPSAGPWSPSAWPPVTVETDAVARLPGGDLRYVLRRSPRSHRLRVTIEPERGVVVSIPPAGRRGWARPEPAIEAFLAEREPWIRRHLERQEASRARLDARPALDEGRLVPYLGLPHGCAWSRRRPACGRRASPVWRCRRRRRAGRRAGRARPPADGGHPRGLVPRPRPRGPRRRDRAPRSAAGRDAGADHAPRHHEPMGELLAQGQPVVLLAPGARAARGARLGGRARAVSPAGVRPRAAVRRAARRHASPTTRRGAGGSGVTPRSCTRPRLRVARPRGRTRGPRDGATEAAHGHGRMSLDSRRRTGNHFDALTRHRTCPRIAPHRPTERGPMTSRLAPILAATIALITAAACAVPIAVAPPSPGVAGRASTPPVSTAPAPTPVPTPVAPAPPRAPRHHRLQARARRPSRATSTATLIPSSPSRHRDTATLRVTLQRPGRQGVAARHQGARATSPSTASRSRSSPATSRP